MAKINQLSRSYNRRDQSVQRAAVDFRPISEGLRNISDAYVNKIKLDNDARLQRDKEEMLRANYAAKDWDNTYITNMDSPAKLQEAFGGTIFGASVPSYSANSKNMESSQYQVDSKNAYDTISMSISNESNRKMFVSSQLIAMEDREAVFNKQAQAFTQQEAANIHMQNLESTYQEYGILSDEFNNMLTDGLQLGYYGSDAATAHAKTQELKIAYGKRDQSAAYTELLYQAVGEINSAYMSDELMEEVVRGQELYVAHGSFLTPDEIEDIQKGVILRVKAKNGAVDAVREGAEDQIHADLLNRVYDITNSDEPIDQRMADADALRKELISMIGGPPVEYSTGIKEQPIILIPQTNTKPLEQMIKMLDTNVTSAPLDPVSHLNGQLSARQAILDVTMPLNIKRQYIYDLTLQEKLTPKEGVALIKEAEQNTSRKYNNLAESAYTSFIDTFFEMPDVDKAQMSTRYNDVLSRSDSFSYTEVVQQLKDIDDSYLKNSTTLNTKGFVLSPGAQLIFDHELVGPPTREKVIANEDLTSMIKAGEEGDLTGFASILPEAMSSFALATSATFQAYATQDIMRRQLNLEGIQYTTNEIGDKEVTIAASLIGPNGNVMLALPLENQEGVSEGLMAVRVVSPKTQNTWGKQNPVDFVEEDQYQNYYLSIYALDKTTNTVIIDENGQYQAGGVERVILVNSAEATGTPYGWTSISQDPKHIAEVKNVRY